MENRQYFGRMKDGREVSLITLQKEAVRVTVTDLGASIVSIVVPDRNGQPTDIVLGYDTAEEYDASTVYFTGIMGRSANRIASGRCTIGSRTIQLAANNYENNLHSGPNGFERRLWTITDAAEDRVTFTLEDGDMEQGFPGCFRVSVSYILSEDSLRLCYEAVCDQDTVCNLTNHVCFNLGGHGSGSVLDHELTLFADTYTPVLDEKAIPTGKIASVAGTVFDFLTPHRIGERIGADDRQLIYGGGYDHNYIIRGHRAGTVNKAAEVYCEKTGIRMEICTDLPAIQLYTGNGLPSDLHGKGGAVYQPRGGICLETQYVPNAINMEGFEKPLLKAGDIYRTETGYRFSAS